MDFYINFGVTNSVLIYIMKNINIKIKFMKSKLDSSIWKMDLSLNYKENLEMLFMFKETQH